MSAEELAALIRGRAEPIPSGEVGGLASQVSFLSGQRPPSTLALKRTFIMNWYAEHGAKLLPPQAGSGDPEAQARAANLSRQTPSGPSPPSSTASPDSSPTRASVGPLPNREELLVQLRAYGRELIPSAQLGAIASTIELLEGTKAPRSIQQKRTFIDDWCAANLQHVAEAASTPDFEASALRAMPPTTSPPPHRTSAPARQQEGGQHASREPSATAGLVGEVHRAYSEGATEQQLHALAAAVSVLTGVPMPSGGVGELGEFVLDFHNWGRHTMQPRPAPLRPTVRAAAPRDAGGQPYAEPHAQTPPEPGYRGLNTPPQVASSPLSVRRPSTAPVERVASLPTHYPTERDREEPSTPRDANLLLAQLDSLTGGDPSQDLPHAQVMHGAASEPAEGLAIPSCVCLFDPLMIF